jgi:hypothetical protein
VTLRRRCCGHRLAGEVLRIVVWQSPDNALLVVNGYEARPASLLPRSYFVSAFALPAAAVPQSAPDSDEGTEDSVHLSYVVRSPFPRPALVSLVPLSLHRHEYALLLNTAAALRVITLVVCRHSVDATAWAPCLVEDFLSTPRPPLQPPFSAPSSSLLLGHSCRGGVHIVDDRTVELRPLLGRLMSESTLAASDIDARVVDAFCRPDASVGALMRVCMPCLCARSCSTAVHIACRLTRPMVLRSACLSSTCAASLRLRRT